MKHDGKFRNDAMRLKDYSEKGETRAIGDCLQILHSLLLEFSDLIY